MNAMQRITEFSERIGVYQLTSETSWGWPVLESIHYVGLSMLFGTVILYDLRVLGVAKAVPVSSIHRFIKIGVAGFIINLITGFMFFISAPANYSYNPAFHIKVICLFIAGLNVLVFYTFLARRTNAVGAGEDAPLSSKIAAGVSFLAWTGVLAGGRFLGFFKPPQYWCEWCGLFN